MCLYVDREKTEKFKKRIKPILVWKWVHVCEGILHSPVMGTEIKIDPKTLEFSTPSSLRGGCKSSDSVSYGIHAYLEKRCGRVRAYVYPEDIIAVGYAGDIVAKRIFFHPNDVGV